MHEGEGELPRGFYPNFSGARYSARQKSLMKLGGLRGDITFRGDLGPFIPYLSIGEMVNAGQGTSFGLGRYKI